MGFNNFLPTYLPTICHLVISIISKIWWIKKTFDQSIRIETIDYIDCEETLGRNPQKLKYLGSTKKWYLLVILQIHMETRVNFKISAKFYSFLRPEMFSRFHSILGTVRKRLYQDKLLEFFWARIEKNNGDRIF